MLPVRKGPTYPGWLQGIWDSGYIEASRNYNSSLRTLTKDVGPSVRILQINIECISAAKSDNIAKILHENRVDAVNIQETHTGDDMDLDKRGQLPGYSLVKAVHHPKYGWI